jgi:hypothetical protein
VKRWTTFVGWIAHREPATPIALVRILAGLVALGMLLNLHASSVGAAIWLPEAHGGMQNAPLTNWIWRWLGPPEPALLWPLFWSGVAGAVLVLVGLGSRLGALVLLQVLMALQVLSPSSRGGFDSLLNNTLWLLVLAPSESTLSLWCRLRSGRWVSTVPRLAWVRYAMVYQLTLMYWTTGVQKVGTDWWPWGDFHAVYYVLLQPPWARWDDGSWAGWISPLTQIGTIGTMVLELTWFMVPLALFYRATRTRPGRLRALSNRLSLRTLYIAGGAAMHVGIWAFMNIGTFSLAAVALYPCAFHHDELVAWIRRRRLTGGAPSAPGAAAG